jgi:hypothetical protein
VTRKEIFEKANYMGVDKTYALKCHMTFLRQQILDKKAHLKELEEDVEQTTGLTRAFIEQSIGKVKQDIKRLRAKHSRLVTPKQDIGGISDDDVDAARDYPIENLVEFNSNGRCMAFCHKSNSESMSWNKRDNKAHCFVCNKSFNPIDVLVYRDGYSFVDAVKELSQ